MVVAGALAWGQYQDAQRTALGNERARAVLAGSVIDTYFRGELATLRSIAGCALGRRARHPRDAALLRRGSSRRDGRAFSAGLGWIDRAGIARGRDDARERRTPSDLSDRSYFWNVIATGRAVRERGRHGRAGRRTST